MSIYKIPELKPGMRVCFADPCSLNSYVGIVSFRVNSAFPHKGFTVLCWDASSSSDVSPSADTHVSVDWLEKHPDDIMWVAEAPDDAPDLFNPIKIGDLIYNKPESKRMTVEQICEALGYPVEIIPKSEGNS